MVIDSSALAAILLGEAEAEAFTRSIRLTETRLLSAAGLVELALVIESRKGDQGRKELDLYVDQARLDIVPFDQVQAEHARHGWRRFGKGRHPAALNLGDCYAYALAKATGEPLLFKGNDFHLTDIEPAI